MEGGESPLEVLSRAATMVQENQAITNNQDDSSKQNGSKQLPTAKWKRERRSRLPEYSRKSDPKIPEVFEQQTERVPSPTSTTANGSAVGGGGSDTPLDMSIRHRGQPPSYTQTINNPSFRSSYRPTVIQNSVPGNRDDIPSGMSMCDPIIDEHFRRSLGNDYLTLFSNNNVSKEPPSPPATASPKSSPPPPVTPAQKIATNNVIEMMDGAGLSVDDHFAKALGETWLKLNGKKENGELKNGENNQSMVST